VSRLETAEAAEGLGLTPQAGAVAEYRMERRLSLREEAVMAFLEAEEEERCQAHWHASIELLRRRCR
jgi:hypothetical protein